MTRYTKWRNQEETENKLWLLMNFILQLSSHTSHVNAAFKIFFLKKKISNRKIKLRIVNNVTYKESEDIQEGEQRFLRLLKKRKKRLLCYLLRKVFGAFSKTSLKCVCGHHQLQRIYCKDSISQSLWQSRNKVGFAIQDRLVSTPLSKCMSHADVIHTVPFVKVKGCSVAFISLKTITDLIKTNCNTKHLAFQQRDGK